MVWAPLPLPLGVSEHSSVWSLSAKQYNEALAWESLVQNRQVHTCVRACLHLPKVGVPASTHTRLSPCRWLTHWPEYKIRHKNTCLLVMLVMEVSITGHFAVISDIRRSRDGLHFEVTKAHATPQSILLTVTSLLYLLLLQPHTTKAFQWLEHNFLPFGLSSPPIMPQYANYNITMLRTLWLFGEPVSAKWQEIDIDIKLHPPFLQCWGSVWRTLGLGHWGMQLTPIFTHRYFLWEPSFVL